MILYEMLTGNAPYGGDDEDELFQNVLQRSVYYPKSISKEAKEVIKGLLHKDPASRLGAGLDEAIVIRSQAFFRRIDFDKVEKMEVQPPYIPHVSNERLMENFDYEHADSTSMTPSDMGVIHRMVGNEFDGFSYINATYLDQPLGAK